MGSFKNESDAEAFSIKKIYCSNICISKLDISGNILHRILDKRSADWNSKTKMKAQIFCQNGLSKEGKNLKKIRDKKSPWSIR